MFAGSMGRKHKVKTKNLLGAVVATLVAGAMGLAGVGSAMADTTRVSDTDLAKQQTLTVTANEDISNRTLKAVPLAYYSYAQSDGKDITGFDLIDAGKAKAIDAAITAANVKNNENSSGYDGSNPMVWVVQNLLDSEDSPWSGKLRDFLDQLKNAGSVVNDRDAVNFSKPENGDGKTMTASVRPGVYAVLDKTVASEGNKVPIAMFNGTGINGITTLKKGDKIYTLGTVDYKVHETTVVKKITSAENGTVGNGGASAETAIGKTVGFEMTSKVPNWTGYDKYYYAINDTYSEGLTFNADTAELQVKVGNTTLGKDVDYKIATTGRDAQGNATFSVVFLNGKTGSEQDEDILPNKAKFPINAEVKVTYKMTVNQNAVAGSADTNTNEVEYSHNPNTVTDHAKTPGETTKVYVGKFTLTKTDTSNAPLAGAEFEVYEGDQTDTPVKFVKSSDGLTYRKADLTEITGTTDTIASVSTNGGVITLTGLDGKYTVKETKSPFGSGIILLTFTLTVKVDQSNGSCSLSQFGQDSNRLTSENTDSKGVTVVNARNIMDMPKTGAVWLCIFGVMTVLLAGASFLLLRRKA